jgi:AraC family transcriptional regulator
MSGSGWVARHGHLSLPFGRFYGQVDVRCHAPGMDIAILNADPHRVVERHSHDDAHFVLVLDGLYASSAAGADAISVGTALIFNPAGTTHRDTFEASARAVTGRFMTLSIAASLMTGATNTSPGAHVIRDSCAIGSALQLAFECSHRQSDSTLMRESLAMTLLAHVSHERNADCSDAPHWLRIAREQLDDRCHEDVRIADVARAAGVHPVYLARIFRRFIGCTPGEYLRRRRLERARVLLSRTQRSLTDVALDSGYVDQSHLAKAFKADTGSTPGAFRRRSVRRS